MKRIDKFVVGIISILMVGSIGCDRAVPEPEPGVKPSAKPEVPEPPELVTETLTPGSGERVVKDGDKIKVHYVGKLLRTGFKFDSAEGEKTFPFTVGEGVIEGWSKGVLGMKVGEKRKLTIPSRLAYKESGHPPKIPPNAPLMFEIELVSFDDPKPAASGSASAGAAPSTSAKVTPAASVTSAASAKAGPKPPTPPAK